jgi:hypothetical protein
MFKQFDKLMKKGRLDKVVKFMEGKKKKKKKK